LSRKLEGRGREGEREGKRERERERERETWWILGGGDRREVPGQALPNVRWGWQQQASL
jgi:hypothetical protein